MSGQRVEAEKTGGKRYVGMGNLSGLLVKRKTEEETLRSVDADEDVEESPSKRDIGVSASWHLNQKASGTDSTPGKLLLTIPLPSLQLHTIAASLMAELVVYGQQCGRQRWCQSQSDEILGRVRG